MGVCGSSCCGADDKKDVRGEWQRRFRKLLEAATATRSLPEGDDGFGSILRLYAHDDVISDLYERPAVAVQYHPQLVNFLLHGHFEHSAKLEVFLLGRSESSLMFAHRTFWFLEAFAPHVKYSSAICGAIDGGGLLSEAQLMRAVQVQGALAAWKVASLGPLRGNGLDMTRPRNRRRRHGSRPRRRSSGRHTGQAIQNAASSVGHSVKQLAQRVFGKEHQELPAETPSTTGGSAASPARSTAGAGRSLPASGRSGGEQEGKRDPDEDEDGVEDDQSAASATPQGATAPAAAAPAGAAGAASTPTRPPSAAAAAAAAAAAHKGHGGKQRKQAAETRMTVSGPLVRAVQEAGVDAGPLMAIRRVGSNGPRREDILAFAEELMLFREFRRLGYQLKEIDIPERKDHLRAVLRQLNAHFLPTRDGLLYVPVGNPHNCMVAIHADHSFCFRTKERVPFMVVFEVIDYADEQGVPLAMDHAAYSHDEDDDDDEAGSGVPAIQPQRPGPYQRTRALESGQAAMDEASRTLRGEEEPWHAANANPGEGEAPDTPERHPGTALLEGRITDATLPGPAGRSPRGVVESVGTDDELDAELQRQMRDFEVTDELSSDEEGGGHSRRHHLGKAGQPASAAAAAAAGGGVAAATASPSINGPPSLEAVGRTPSGRRRRRRQEAPADVLALAAPAHKAAAAARAEAAAAAAGGMQGDEEDEEAPRRPGEAVSVVFPQRWRVKEESLRRKSPVGHRRGWRLMPLIVKANDDLRQEQFVCQLLKQFQRIWADANVPVFVRPYDILATSRDSGLVEAIPDTISIDALKRAHETPQSLRQFFLEHFGGGSEDSRRFRRAQRNFIASMAGYAIICYILQIKDRHNGNILLDRRGHLIHIDFGFLLSNSPGGNMNFEAAPFKLTKEHMDVMGGPRSKEFGQFRNLCARAFLAARKHKDKIILLVQMMLQGNEDLPCFRAGKQAIMEALKRRFAPGIPARKVVTYVNNLIDLSSNNWRTRWYDAYQRMSMGIL